MDVVVVVVVVVELQYRMYEFDDWDRVGNCSGANEVLFSVNFASWTIIKHTHKLEHWFLFVIVDLVWQQNGFASQSKLGKHQREEVLIAFM